MYGTGSYGENLLRPLTAWPAVMQFALEQHMRNMHRLLVRWMFMVRPHLTSASTVRRRSGLERHDGVENHLWV